MASNKVDSQIGKVTSCVKAMTAVKSKDTHKIPSHPMVSKTNETIKSPIKLNNTMDKVKYSLLNNWIENGFIENMRSQIRCQLIKELRHPFKHQKHGALNKENTINILSLNQRIMNSIFIDYLKHYSYNYSLSVFKSEIGGELIGSLPIQDTHRQLHINNNDIVVNDVCIIEQLIECNRNIAINTYHQTLEKEQDLEILSLQKQLKQQLEFNSMDEDDKIKTLKRELENANETIVSLKDKIKNFEPRIKNDEWQDKYHKIYNELMTTLNREKELQCLLDEEHIKLKSAKREIDYLEKLLVAQDDNNSTNHIEISKIVNPINRDSEIDVLSSIKPVRRADNSFKNNTLSQKYEEMDVYLKKRLQIQAMLESDTRRLTYHTKEFFTNLNQQKNQTYQVMNKLDKLKKETNEEKIDERKDIDLEDNPNDNNIDYAQSESFAGVDFMQSNFLEQYQKHIENVSNS